MTQDYLLRMIQQIAAAIAGIVAHRQRGDFTGAEAELQKLSLQYTGLPLFVVKHSPPDAVVELLATGGGLQHARGVWLAELLVQDAALAEARGNPPDAVQSLRLAARLLTDALGTLTVDEETHYREKLAAIATKRRDLGDVLP